MHRLYVLGRIDFRDPVGREARTVVAQPKRLALLAYLAANSGSAGCRRDRLLGLFWPELDEQRARKALNKAVHFLRREIGAEALVSRNGDEVEVDATRLWCDAAAFQAAIKSGDCAEALDLYVGDLLPSFYVDDAPAFDEWMEQERTRLRLVAADAARDLAVERERDGNATIAISLARRAAALSNLDERVVRQLLALLDRLGDRAGALDVYDRFARRLADEFEAEPAIETKRLMAEIRVRDRELPHQPRDVAAIDVHPTTTTHFTPNSERAQFEALRARGDDIEREVGHGGGQPPSVQPTARDSARMLAKALAIYVVAVIAGVAIAMSATMSLGLPDWVFPGALIVLSLGLPVLLLTGYAHTVASRLRAEPTSSPDGSPIDRRLGPVVSMAIKASPYLSWRRAAKNGFYAVAAFVGVVGAFMWLRAAGVRPFASLLTAGTLDTNAPLLVADFNVTGPDTALSSPLAQVMRESLGQSRVVSIVPISRIVAALQLMRRAPDSKLDLALAREIAQREGVKAVLAGTLTPLSGGGYLVSTRLVMASSGDELAAFHETVDAAKDIVPAMDRLTRKLRERIGESLKLVRADPPLAQVTTGSLEALKKYTAALQLNAQGDYGRALALLNDAIAIDSTFAMAHRQLGLSTGNARPAGTGLGGFPVQSGTSFRANERLYALRDRLPERERLLALSAYYAVHEGDRTKALLFADTLLAEFPATPGALNAIVTSYVLSRREYARAESMYVRVIAAEPTVRFAYLNIVLAQLGQGKYDAARASFDRARRQFPNYGWISEYFYYFGFLDSAEAIARAQTTSANALDRLYGHNMLSILAAIRGRIGEARTHLGKVRALERERGEQPRALDDSLIAAQIEIVLFNRQATAARILDRAIGQTPLESISWPRARPYLRIASLYAQAGRADKAKVVLAAYDRAVTDSAQRRSDQPDRDAAAGYIALAELRPRDAVAAFRRSDMRADGPVGQCGACVEPSIGLAFDKAEMPDSAIAALERFVNTPRLTQIFVDAWNLQWVLRRLGELHEARGDRADAVKYYQRFVDLWKNADPELQPSVMEVKRRLARLSTGEAKN